VLQSSTISVDKTFLSLDVGTSELITISGALANVSVNSSNSSLILVSISGNIITVSAVGATDPDYETVVATDGIGSISIKVYSAIPSGGIL